MKIKNYIIQGLLPLFVAGMFIAPVFSSCEDDDAPTHVAPTLTVQEIANALRTSATLTGSVSGETSLLKEYGFDYSTSQDFPSDRTTRVPMTDSENPASLSVQVKGLTPNERYYYRLYASTGASTVYSDTQDFRTANMSAPQIGDLVVDSIGEQYARFIFQVEDYGNEVLIECGVSYKKSDSKTFIPVASEEITTDARYVIEISDLEADTQYDFRPYAKNAQDKDASTGSIEGYGNILTQKTAALLSADVETNAIEDGDISITSVKVAGTILSAVGSDGVIDECGFVYSQTNPLPTYNSDKKVIHKGKDINVNGGKYTYTEDITELLQKTLYYVRAYAKNTVNGEERISYGTAHEVTTKQLNTPAVEFIYKDDYSLDYTSTATSLTVKASINNYDANALLEKGVIWSRSNGQLSLEDAKAAGTYQAVTNGENMIVTTINNLEMSCSYYVRAYAVYKSGDLTEIGYSNSTQIYTEGFYTPNLGIEINNEKLTYNSAELTGKMESAGNTNITERGFVLSRSLSDVTLDNCDKTIKADDSFVATITGLTYLTNYYVRAYAKCELGGKAETAYSGYNSFQTKDIDRPKFDGFNNTATLSSLDISITITPGKQGTIVKRGFCAILNENNAPDPTIDDLKTEEDVTAVSSNTYKAELKGLRLQTSYKVRAYAVIQLETGEQLVCYSGTWWLNTAGPSIRMEFTSTETQCTIQATIETDIELSDTEYGFIWTEEDTWEPEKVTNKLKCTNMDATRTFSGVIGNLTGGKRYFVWIFYTTIDGRTIYNDGRWEFTTKRAPGQGDNVSPGQKQ